MHLTEIVLEPEPEPVVESLPHYLDEYVQLGLSLKEAADYFRCYGEPMHIQKAAQAPAQPKPKHRGRNEARSNTNRKTYPVPKRPGRDLS